MTVASIHEQEVLRQLHHRVKNNLQVICSLLRLQANYLTDDATRAMFKNSEERVRSMALVHEKLCRHDDPSAVQFDEYIRELVDQLLKSYSTAGNKVQVDLQLESIRLPIEQAVPCGLIINELVSNCLKYGGGEAGSHLVGVKLGQRDSRIDLEIWDHGSGLPSSVDIGRPESFGLRVVQALTRQLGASLSVERGLGTSFRMHFRASKEARVEGETADASAENSHL